MANGHFKDVTRRPDSDKIFRDKTFNIAKNKKYDRYQRVLPSVVYNIFDKETSGSGIKNNNMSNKELAVEIHQPIIRKFLKRKVYAPFIDNIWWCAINK